MNPVVRSDMEVSHFLDSVGAVCGYDKERRDHLLDILDVDLSWRMHQVPIMWLYEIEPYSELSYIA
jgi:CCR4-NOT complex subunit CAF16